MLSGSIKSTLIIGGVISEVVMKEVVAVFIVEVVVKVVSVVPKFLFIFHITVEKIPFWLFSKF